MYNIPIIPSDTPTSCRLFSRKTLRAETLAAVPGSVKRLQVDLDLEPLHRRAALPINDGDWAWNMVIKWEITSFFFAIIDQVI